MRLKKENITNDLDINKFSCKNWNEKQVRQFLKVDCWDTLNDIKRIFEMEKEQGLLSLEIIVDNMKMKRAILSSLFFGALDRAYELFGDLKWIGKIKKKGERLL